LAEAAVLLALAFVLEVVTLRAVRLGFGCHG
jgi:hypothetical protein